MSESNHTPGPWLWRGKSGSLHQKGEPPYTYGEAVLEASYEYDTGVDTVVSEANARLIAAAPDLLQMLKVAQLWLDIDGRYDMQGINAAIAKAEGGL